MFRSVMRRALRVQYASDLHLEFLGDKPVFQSLLKPVAPVLVLAGDVGRPDKRSYRDLLFHCSRNWDDVIVVAGNHEYYDGVAEKRLEQCRMAAAEFNNVHFLERERVVRHGVTFLGCTLWTHGAPQDVMNDYRAIRLDGGSKPLRVGDTNSWHARDKEWLRLALANVTGPAVVVTHHLPSFRLIAPEFADSPYNSGFASRCDELIAPPVRVWIAGHTHRAMRVRFDGGVVACVNPLGYPDELGSGYRTDAVVEVPLDPPGEEEGANDGGLLDRMAAAHATGALSGFVGIEDDVVFV
jgi:predicted phosphodiesterase